MKKLISVLSLIIVMTAFSATSVEAYYYNTCQPTYGGGQVCPEVTVVINKTVQDPKTGKYVDNLSVNDGKYGAGSIVAFNLAVTNPTNVTVNNVVVKDTFPQYVTFYAGPGAYDAKTNSVSFLIKELKAGETQNIVVTGKVVTADAMPATENTVCVTNVASATINNMENSDNASFCLVKPVVTTKGGLPVYGKPEVKSTPKTGPEAMALVTLIPTGLAGVFMRKLSTKR